MSAGAEYSSEFKRLMFLGRGRRGLHHLQQAANLADEHQNVVDGIRARLRLMDTANFTGRSNESLIAFTWCVAECEKNPALFEQFRRDILWKFKWITSSICKYASISREQIEHTFGEMTRFYDRVGISHRAIESLRAQVSIPLGDFAEIPRHREAWLAAPGDGTQDCPACESSTLAELYLASGEPQRAVEVAAGLIAGWMRCAEQPQLCHANLLIPLFRLGQFDVAQRLQVQSFNAIMGNLEFLGSQGSFMAFLGLTDQFARAVSALETAFCLSLECQRGWERLRMQVGARLLLMRLEAVGTKELKLRLDPGIAFYAVSGVYPVRLLLEWSENEARAVAADFDQRNGNSGISGMITANDDLLERPHPITVPAEGKVGVPAEQ